MKNGFTKGVAVVIAEIIRDYDEPTMARGICDSCGFSLKDFKEAGIEDYDLQEIKKIF